MSRKRHSPGQIINKLPFGFAQGGEPVEPQQAEVELARAAQMTSSMLVWTRPAGG